MAKFNYFPVLLLLITLISILPLFFNLSFLPIRLFDESRLAVNALEMNDNNNFLVTHYKNEPDMWNVKPPLVIWCQTFMMKLVGIGELAVRLPSALAGLLTVLIVFFFVNKITSSKLLATLASLILIATPGYVTEHGTRSGDYDAMLVLFQMLYLFLWYTFLKDTTQIKTLYFTLLAVLFAVLTKGIAGLLFLPSLFIFTLIEGKISDVLKCRHFWYGIASVLLIVFTYYLLREIYNPGYINKVYENEIYYRYFDVNEGHEGGWSFYIDYILSTSFSTWYVFAVLGVVSLFLIKDKIITNFLLYVLISASMFLLIISNSQTKIEWYAMPLYPLLSILTATFFWYGYKFVAENNAGKLSLLKWAPIVVFAAFFIVNYSKVMSPILHPDQTEKQNDLYKFSYLFQSAYREEININGHYYCYPPYNAQFHFYTEAMNKKKQHVQLIEMEKLQKGMKVLAATNEVKNYITTNFQSKVEREYESGIILFEIQ